MVVLAITIVATLIINGLHHSRRTVSESTPTLNNIGVTGGLNLISPVSEA